MSIKKYCWLAALPMIFTACQDDALVENLPQDGMIYSLSAQVDGTSSMSRAQVQLNNPNSGDELFYWNTGDSFSIYQKEKENNYYHSVFKITEDYQEPTESNQTSATFIAETPAYASLNYCAVYPSDVQNEWGSLQFNLRNQVDFTNKTQAEAWKEYFQKNMFMMATGNFSDVENASVSFRHLCAMARFTYVNQTGESQTLKNIYMDAAGQEVGWDYRYQLADGTGEINGFGYRYDLEINGLTVENGETVDLYMMFFPFDFYDGQLTLTVNNENHPKSLDIEVADIAAANPGATGFEAGKRYWFTVTETGDALYLKKDFETVTIPNVEFSAALYNVLGSEKVTLNEDGHAVMTRGAIKSVTDLQLGWQDYVIPSLAGIENFVNLESLGCANVGLQTCDLSQNTKLVHLVLDWNKLTTLDLSNNKKLASLIVSYNDSLSSLILPDTETLFNLSIGNTVLESLTVPNPVNVQYLSCGRSKISSLDLTNYNNLIELDVSYLGFENLDFIPDPIKSQLRLLICDGNVMGALDLTNYGGLETLRCGKQKNKWMLLTMTETQKASWNSSWKNEESNLYAYPADEAQPESVTFDNVELAPALKHALGEEILLFEDNTAVMLKSLVEAKTGLSLYGYKGSYTSLTGIEQFVNVKELICVENDLVSLDVSGMPNLEILDCRDNKLQSLTVSGCTALNKLECFGNLLSTLDVSANTALETLKCGNQKDETVLTLTLNDNQKSLWESTWSTYVENGNNVTLAE
ncbi:MAG: hypothetical protein IJY59_06255 [Bacteroidaceae bacterium]|nr:hypothetical protein [Bacteroidaceae bacterium]